MRNKIWGYFLAAILIFSNIGNRAVFVHAQNETVVSIGSLDEFYEFAEACSLDTWSEGKTVLLETDISFANVNDIAAVPYFKGIFDGQGHTISGLVIGYDGSVQGLFRYIGEGGTVKNLNVVGTVSPQGSMMTVGGIAGENRGTIINCTYTGVVKGSSVVGGIVGNNEQTGVIGNCRTLGIVHGDHYVGGIAGKNSGNIENCINKTNVNTSTEELTLNLEYMNLENLRSTENTTDITDVGGIAGYSAGKIESCINQGTIGYQHVGYNVGGITGRQSGYVNNCTNYGTIYGRKDIGGINGQMEPYNTLIFSETTLMKLGEQLDVLQADIDVLIADADDYSDTVTGRLSDMHTHVSNAQSSVETMLKEVQGVFNADTDTLNELSDRITEIIDKMVPVSENLTSASDRLKASIRSLREAVDGLEEASGITQEGIAYIEQALDEMADAQADFEMAAAPAEKAGQNLEEALAAFAEALRLIQENAPVDDIEQKASQGAEALADAAENLEVAGNSIQAGLEDISDALAALQSAAPYLKDAQDPLKDAFTDTEASLEELYRVSSSMKEVFAGVERILQDLDEKEGLSFSRLEGEFDTSQDMLSESLSEISDILDFINSTVADKNARISSDIQAVSDQLFAVMDTIREAFTEKEEEKEYVEDISYEDTGEQTEGKTAFCTNNGAVEGDVNVGGITGSMSIEYDFDPEDDVKTEGDTSADFIYQTRAVIRSCENTGAITARKNSVGGIVGNMDLGSVIDSRAYGSITSDSGRYTGGIAGYSQADIRHSYAKCTLSGNDYVGGIAGEGKNIFQCYSLVNIEDSGEYTGAVAGNVSGVLENNYFVSETLAGVDGISYSGQAEPMAYADFAALDGMPVEFKSFHLVFCVDDETVYETEFEYGADLSSMELPQLPIQQGCYASWEETDYSHLIFDTIVNAVYDDNITALESAEKRKELPLIVVEGSFDDKARLILNAQEADASDITGKNQLLEIWKLQIPEDGNAEHRIQYLMPAADSEIEIEYKTENGWVKANAKADGRYLVWQADGAEIIFRSVQIYSYAPVIFAAAGVIVLISVGALVLRKRKKAGKKTRDKKAQNQEAENGEQEKVGTERKD